MAVTIDGERLRVDAPRGVLTDELRRTLSEHKPEIVELIRHRASDGDTSEQATAADRVAAMTLGEFAKAGLVVRISSSVLDAEVLIVSDDVPDSALSGLDSSIYRARELRKLAILRPSPRALQCIHDVKTIFHGAITDVRPRDNRNG